MTSREKIGNFNVGVSIFVWGTMAPVSKILLGQYNAIFILSSGALIASAILFAMICATNRLPRLFKTPMKDLAKMAALGVLGYYAYNYLYMIGISRLTSVQAMIINYLWPAMVIIFSCIVSKGKIHNKTVFIHHDCTSWRLYRSWEMETYFSSSIPIILVWPAVLLQQFLTDCIPRSTRRNLMTN